jgi:GAF domain-containing protein
LRIAAHRGFGREFLDHFQTVAEGDHCVCGTSLKTRTRLLVPDVTSDPLFENSESRQVLLRAEVRAVQSTPLITPEGRFIGMVATHYRRSQVPLPRTLRSLDQLTSVFLTRIAAGAELG